MQDPNSPEMVAQRAAQTDPIIMYLIVRESLNMSIGKTAAQCAHAAQILLQKYYISEIINNDIFSKKHKLFEDWLNSSFRKVVLRADEKEWVKLKEEFKDQNMSLVIDNGLTEISPGSETCIGLWPIKKSQVSKLIKRLQVLK